MIYGKLPDDLGLVDISPVEMMFWMYCPVSLPGSFEVLPDNLEIFRPIITEVYRDVPNRFEGDYIYLTAKTLWVDGDYIGNRPGWHSDGFGTDDLNYIWYDRAPTEFCEMAEGLELPADCGDAMEQMAEAAVSLPTVTYPAKHLLRLDQRVIHRSPATFAPGMRTFVKVSVSADRYNLAGNSVNHRLGVEWPTVPRLTERNHPARHEDTDR